MGRLGQEQLTASIQELKSLHNGGNGNSGHFVPLLTAKCVMQKFNMLDDDVGEVCRFTKAPEEKIETQGGLFASLVADDAEHRVKIESYHDLQEFSSMLTSQMSACNVHLSEHHTSIAELKPDNSS